MQEKSKILDKLEELSKIKEKNLKKQDKIKSNIDDIEERIKKNEKIVNNSDVLKINIDELEIELESLNAHENDLEKKNKDLSVQIQNTENKIRELSIEKLKIEEDDKKEKIKDLNNFLNHCLSEFNNLNDEKSHIKAKKAILNDDLKRITEDYALTESAILDLEKLEKDSEYLKYDLTLFDNSGRFLDKQIKEFEDSLEKLDNEDYNDETTELKEIKSDLVESDFISSESAKIKELENEIASLKQESRKKDERERLKRVSKVVELNDLIYPISTSYRIATETSTNKTAKAMKYFNFFEFIAAFNSIVLISALPDQIYENNKNRIWEDFDKFKKISFGNWVGLHSRITKMYRNFDDEVFERIPFNNEFYVDLSHKKINRILEPIPQIRNKAVHEDKSLDEDVAEEIIEILTPSINDILEKMLVYDSLDLIYPMTMTKNEDYTYKINIKNLKGAYTPFGEDIISTPEDMISYVLHLYNVSTDERLILKPKLINLKKCKQCANWSIYIYNKIDKDGAIYTSYQNEPHNYKNSLSIQEIFNID